jgi:hypothetical protein
MMAHDLLSFKPVKLTMTGPRPLAAITCDNILGMAHFGKLLEHNTTFRS